jgi:hypothetical protein
MSREIAAGSVDEVELAPPQVAAVVNKLNAVDGVVGSLREKSSDSIVDAPLGDKRRALRA